MLFQWTPVPRYDLFCNFAGPELQYWIVVADLYVLTQPSDALSITCTIEMLVSLVLSMMEIASLATFTSSRSAC